MNTRGTGTGQHNDCSALCRGRHKCNRYIQSFWGKEKRSREIMKVFEDSSLSFTCGGGKQREGETENELVKDLKESQTHEYRFHKTL